MHRFLLAAAFGLCMTSTAFAQRPERPAAEFGRTITSDDGAATATLISRGGTYTLPGDVSYRRTGVFVAATSDVVIDLAGHTLTFGTDDTSGCCGISPITRLAAGRQFGHDDKAFSQALDELDYGNRTLTIKGPGTIRWGGEQGGFAAAVGGYYTYPVVLENVRLEVGGPDAACFSGQHLTMRDCVCINRSTSTTNRHQAPANIRASGHCIADRNVLLGGNSGFAVGSGSRIRHNLIRHDAFATNGYGVFLYRNAGVEVSGNLIVPVNGRGVLVNGSTEIAEDPGHVIRENIILALEKPNSEFGNNLEPCCLRSRYNVKKLVFERNTCLAVGGTGLTSATTVYLSNYATGGSNRIVDNELASMLIGETDLRSNKFAAALGLIGQGRLEAESPKEGAAYVADDVIEKNRVSTNNVVLCVSHTDGGCNSVPVHLTSLRWSSGAEIAERFEQAVKGWLDGHGFAREHLADEYLPRGADPAQTAVFYAGRYLGSKVDVVVAEEIGRPEGTLEVLLHSSNYPLEVSLNGKQVVKPAAPIAEEAAERAAEMKLPADSDLARVIKAWPKLSPEARAAILKEIDENNE